MVNSWVDLKDFAYREQQADKLVILPHKRNSVGLFFLANIFKDNITVTVAEEMAW